MEVDYQMVLSVGRSDVGDSECDADSREQLLLW